MFGMAFDIPYAVCVIVMAALTGVYVILGGYMATAINDFIQGIVMLFGIIAVIWAVLNGQGGFYEAIKELAKFESDVPATMGQQGVFTSFFYTINSFAATVKIIKNAAFKPVKIKRYFFVSLGYKILNSLKVIRLARDAISVPVPPIFTPKSKEA